ncbi:XdhC family protein [Niallia alba]|uniref:XdhC family protein n=1 Tax=Niallia circulans TaxID=1397 RepID=A0A941GL39_NIACI|nr:XdhC family protein [Niallia circulans]MCB5238010.1 XdhC family protein [Niallia circulans]
MSSDHYSVIDSVLVTECHSYLATIVKVEGSAYRKEGTMMLISDKGMEKGLLTGGCVEQDLLARIAMQESDEAFLMEYDLRSEDDLSWGQGVGCDGKIYILVEPITFETRNVFLQLNSLLQNGHKVKLVKVFNKVNKYIENSLKTNIEEENTSIVSLDTEDRLIFNQILYPRPKLIIYGAGPDVKPVVYFASKAGFYVILSDWRQAYCSEETIPYAKEYHIGTPSKVMEEINPTENDYVITMSHSFMKDQEIVEYLLQRKVKYFGLLGSRKRSERLLAGIIKPDWIHYPVGLPIYSESPEEIAISIIAELIKTKNEKKAVAREQL